MTRKQPVYEVLGSEFGVVYSEHFKECDLKIKNDDWGYYFFFADSDRNIVHESELIVDKEVAIQILKNYKAQLGNDNEIL